MVDWQNVDLRLATFHHIIILNEPSHWYVKLFSIPVALADAQFVRHVVEMKHQIQRVSLEASHLLAHPLLLGTCCEAI